MSHKKYFPTTKVNKEQAERCRDIGAEALRKGQYERAVKFLDKSQKLHALPGVQALLSQANKRMNAASAPSAAPAPAPTAAPTPPPSAARSASTTSTASTSTSSSRTTSNNNTGADGRTYTQAQVDLVNKILKAKEGGRGGHYRVLGIPEDADDNALKKAYRKLALKLHPDKNSAPKADDAFKALGLAYATLSDPQKRTIYDRFGEEDPDNRGGGGGGGFRHGGGGQGVHFNGQNVNPEDIFNMFFGGGMPGGVHMNMGGMPGGFRVYSNGFGGMPGGMPRRQGQRQQQAQEPQTGFGALLQLLPVLLLFILSFFNGAQSDNGHTGGNQYFSLTVSLLGFLFLSV